MYFQVYQVQLSEDILQTVDLYMSSTLIFFVKNSRNYCVSCIYIFPSFNQYTSVFNMPMRKKHETVVAHEIRK